MTNSSPSCGHILDQLSALKVWHTMADDKSHLDWEAIRRTAAVLRVFVAEFLHVRL